MKMRCLVLLSIMLAELFAGCHIETTSFNYIVTGLPFSSTTAINVHNEDNSSVSANIYMMNEQFLNFSSMSITLAPSSITQIPVSIIIPSGTSTGNHTSTAVVTPCSNTATFTFNVTTPSAGTYSYNRTRTLSEGVGINTSLGYSLKLVSAYADYATFDLYYYSIILQKNLYIDVGEIYSDEGDIAIQLLRSRPGSPANVKVALLSNEEFSAISTQLQLTPDNNCQLWTSVSSRSYIIKKGEERDETLAVVKNLCGIPFRMTSLVWERSGDPLFTLSGAAYNMRENEEVQLSFHIDATSTAVGSYTNKIILSGFWDNSSYTTQIPVTIQVTKKNTQSSQLEEPIITLDKYSVKADDQILVTVTNILQSSDVAISSDPVGVVQAVQPEVSESDVWTGKIKFPAKGIYKLNVRILNSEGGADRKSQILNVLVGGSGQLDVSYSPELSPGKASNIIIKDKDLGLDLTSLATIKVNDIQTKQITPQYGYNYTISVDLPPYTSSLITLNYASKAFNVQLSQDSPYSDEQISIIVSDPQNNSLQNYIIQIDNQTIQTGNWIAVAGSHKLTVTNEGYMPYEKTINVVAKPVLSIAEPLDIKTESGRMTFPLNSDFSANLDKSVSWSVRIAGKEIAKGTGKDIETKLDSKGALQVLIDDRIDIIGNAVVKDTSIFAMTAFGIQLPYAIIILAVVIIGALFILSRIGDGGGAGYSGGASGYGSLGASPSKPSVGDQIQVEG